MMTRKFSLWAGLGIVGLVGCNLVGGDEAPGPGGSTDDSTVFTRRRSEPPKAVATRLTLKTFDSCQALETYIEDGAVQEMKVALDRIAANGGGPVAQRGGADFNQAGAAPTAPPGGLAAVPPPMSAGGSTAAAPSAYTKTNTQVMGVDEADFVKNDGQRIFVLSGRWLHAVASWPPQSLDRKWGIEIEGQPREMFLDEQGRIVVISEIFEAYKGGPQPPSAGAAVAGPVSSGPAVGIAAPCLADSAGGGGCGGGGAQVTTTKLTVLTTKGVATVEVSHSYLMPGRYVNSRRVGSSVRVVQSDDFSWPLGMRYYPDGKDTTIYGDKDRWKAAVDALRSENEKLIRARVLEDWIPKPRLVRRGNTVIPLGYGCSDFAYSSAPTRMGLLTVATLNLDSPEAQPARTSIVAQPGEVYASKDNLYVANRHWWWFPEAGQKDFTYLHKFDISKPDRAIYRASGGVDGYIVDQFSMDEYKGNFRVATTVSALIRNPQDPSGRSFTQEITNRVNILSEKTGELQMVGAVADLAKGERIYSSRFLGDRGFVVTFRQVDPLFTFDLSNPTAPKKVGELKIPGFSTYIHPLGDNHLLTIGTYVPDPTQTQPGVVRPVGPQRAVQLQIFDVSNLAMPRLAFTQLIGTSSGNSEALQEHKAFNYFPERKLLAIPFTDYMPAQRGANYWDTFVSDIRVFDVDPIKGIMPRGALSMKDVYAQNARQNWVWYYNPAVRRSVMASDPDGNDFVYAISDAGVRVANLKDLTKPLATARFAAPID